MKAKNEKKKNENTKKKKIEKILSSLSRAPHKTASGNSHRFRIERKNGRNFLFFPSLNILYIIYTKKNSFQRRTKKKKSFFFCSMVWVHPNKPKTRKTNANKPIAVDLSHLLNGIRIEIVTAKKIIYWEEIRKLAQETQIVFNAKKKKKKITTIFTRCIPQCEIHIEIFGEIFVSLLRVWVLKLRIHFSFLHKVIVALLFVCDKIEFSICVRTRECIWLSLFIVFT